MPNLKEGITGTLISINPETKLILLMKQGNVIHLSNQSNDTDLGRYSELCTTEVQTTVLEGFSRDEYFYDLRAI